MLNLNDLQLFVHVVNNGGFTAASRALQMPKQTLSKRISELERRTGVRLIQRTARSFAVTEVGSELHRHASAMLVEAEAAENFVLGRLAEPSGTVRITASVPTAQGRLATLLPSIAKSYPKIRIILHASDRFVDVLQEGYDIALRAHSAPLPDSDLVQRRVGKEEFWLVAAPSYLDGRTATEPQEIEGLDGILSDLGSERLTLTDRNGLSRQVALRARFFANEGTAILAAAKAGLGIASLPYAMCADGLRSGALRRVCPNWIAGEITTTLLMPHRRGMLPSVRIVSDMIIKHIHD